MTISSSLNAGVAGLMTNASRLASISDNISNASTYGYKRVETDFLSMVLSQNGSGTYAAGGVRAVSNRMIDQNGALVSTSNPTDLAVRGRGFLPVASASAVQQGVAAPQMQLTTTGSFRTDSEGLLRSDAGHVLMGWPADNNGSIPAFPRDTSDGLEPIRINVNQLTGEPTTRMSLGVNLPATSTSAGAPGNAENLSLEYYDNLGQSETVEVEFTPTVPGGGNSNAWTMVIRDSAQPGTIIGEYELTFNDARANGGTLDTVTTVSGGPYDPATGELSVNVASGPISISVGRPGTSEGLTQLSDTFAPLSISKDGFPVGNMTSLEVEESGLVRAFYDNGSTRTVYQIPLVDLPNPNGVRALDNQTYVPTPDSGAFFLWDAGDGPAGDIAAFAREESNTDVAGELTNMIKTQRSYSTNAKLIQTVDEILQETTNMKR